MSDGRLLNFYNDGRGHDSSQVLIFSAGALRVGIALEKVRRSEKKDSLA